MTLNKAKHILELKSKRDGMVCRCSYLEYCHRCVIERLLPEEIVEEAEIVVTVYELVRKILLNSPEVKIECINKDANLREDLGIDNSDISWIMIAIEVELDVKITVSEFVNKITTVEDIVNSVVEKMKKQKGEKDV